MGRRGWILLPLLSLLTIVLTLGALEVTGTLLFPRGPKDLLSCMVSDSAGVRGIPNSACFEKVAEGPTVEYKFNACGDRAGMDCGPKPRDTLRVVTVGSSFVFGYGVKAENTWTALLPAKLSEKAGRKVEVYNAGMYFGFPPKLALRFHETLARKPDVIVWVITSLDVANPPVPEFGALRITVSEGASKGRVRVAWNRLQAAFANQSTSEALLALWGQTRSALLVQHVLFASQSQFVRSSLLRGDDSLKAQPSEQWQGQLRQFDRYAADVEARATAAGVPFVALLLPSREQAAIVSMGDWPAGIDPYKLDRDLRSIITSHGGTYVDLLPRFHDIANPERYYFPVDGHLNAAGHRMVADLLSEPLVNAVTAATPARP